jgi:demethylmenaquinone methyltransferase/2-methoxy-6-polyprenyl-1,4-benzoquinol methylase
LTCARSILWPSITGNSPRRTVSTSGSSGIWFLKVEALTHTAYKVHDAKEGQASMNEQSTTHFGYQTVNEDDKAGMVHGVFTRVASKYDIMNDLMSAGIHRLWKEAMMDWLNPRPGQRLLDVAGGTGDVAFRFLGRAPGSVATVLDMTESMLIEGRKRAEAERLSDRLNWIVGDAMALPFADNSFDTYTISFGIRNVVRVQDALTEAFRVLRPGGRLMVLEFSQIPNEMLQKAYDLYSFNVIPPLGKLVTGDRDSYQYLVESIRKFPEQEVFAGMIRKAGFAQVKYRNLTMGVAALHSGWKV